MSKAIRLPQGGLINRDRALSFTLDGKSYRGFEGDSLASALIANGETLLGRSFKYHRPRGLMTAGAEEPNGLLTVGEGAASVPNTRATMTPLREGMITKTQNAWPSVKFDVGAINNLLSPVLGAGFYYKTFIGGGPYVWRAYEYFIRRAAGLGSASQEPFPARFEKVNAYCDVLIVGGGPAGLSAALSAGRAGARVVLVDEGLVIGSILAGNSYLGINAVSANDWRLASLAELAAMPHVRILPKTTAFGLYDGQVAGLLQRLDPTDPTALAERYWNLRCKKIILATGAIERPIAFAGNDRPGVMLANALATYARQFAVLPGENPLIFTNNDSTYGIAAELAHLGARSVTLVDSRTDVCEDLQSTMKHAGVDLICGHGIARVKGLFDIEGVKLVDLVTGNVRNQACDVIGASGGWSPSIHLASHRGTKPTWSDDEQAFLAGQPAPGSDWSLAGSVQGAMSVLDAMTKGAQAGAAAVESLGFKAETLEGIQINKDSKSHACSPFWVMPTAYIGRAKAFVDFQHDVTTKDVKQAAQEGFLSPEHMKRYTTLGMATDQGKLSNTVGHALLAKAQNRSMAEVGTTTYRPPFTPVSLGAFVERNTLEQWMPERMSPLSPWHRANGAEMIETADWRRAWFYPRGIEDISAASRREAFHVRQHVGLCDVSTLGKIEVQGPDAGRLLDLAYVNRLSKLKIGKSRYGLMLREDGIVLDDGTASRLGEDHYFITTTTAEAPHVMAHLEHMLQVEFPELRVHVTSVSDSWAAMALAGPKSRAVLENLIDAVSVSNESLPFMGFIENVIDGHPVRIHRISFSGERAYEIYTPSRSGIAVWQALLAAGKTQNIDVYGLEALDLLRIEKGFPTGSEIDGRTTLKMLGLEGMAKDEKDFIGRVLRKREAMVAETVPTLVGLQPVVPDAPLKGGGQLVRESTPQKMHDQLGYVSSAGYSTTHGRYLGLGFLRGGLENWEGQRLYVADPVRGQHMEVTVVSPVHVDQAGDWVRG